MREQIAFEAQRLITLWQRQALARVQAAMAAQQKGEAFHG